MVLFDIDPPYLPYYFLVAVSRDEYDGYKDQPNWIAVRKLRYIGSIFDQFTIAEWESDRYSCQMARWLCKELNDMARLNSQ